MGKQIERSAATPPPRSEQGKKLAASCDIIL
jgi:hypothetical protein